MIIRVRSQGKLEINNYTRGTYVVHVSLAAVPCKAKYISSWSEFTAVSILNND